MMFRDSVRKRTENGWSHTRMHDSKSKLTREEKLTLGSNRDQKILFSEFLKNVLDFQLGEHEKFLKKFRLLFKQVDTDNNGVLNEHEFT
jgi:hypothetical protein